MLYRFFYFDSLKNNFMLKDQLVDKIGQVKKRIPGYRRVESFSGLGWMTDDARGILTIVRGGVESRIRSKLPIIQQIETIRRQNKNPL